MKALYDAVVIAHALAGLVTLLSLVPPLVAKKGSRVHRRAGWVFVASMIAVGVTGAFIAGCWAAIPLTVQPQRADADAATLAHAAQVIREFSLFFAALAVLTSSAVWHGISGLRLKRTPAAQWATRGDHLAYAATIGIGLPLTLLGLVRGQPLFIAFGGLCLWGGWGDMKFVRNPPDARGAWLLRHLQSMLGGATAALTAFCVLGLRRVWPELHDFALVFWIVPVVLGMAGSIAWTRVYRARLG